MWLGCDTILVGNKIKVLSSSFTSVLSPHASYAVHGASPLLSCHHLSGDHVRGRSGLRAESVVDSLAGNGIGESHHRKAHVREARGLREWNTLSPAREQARTRHRGVALCFVANARPAPIPAPHRDASAAGHRRFPL